LTGIMHYCVWADCGTVLL